MNEQEWTELGRLKEQQARLQQELTSLSRQLMLLERRLSQPEPQLAQPTPQTPAPAPLPRPGDPLRREATADSTKDSTREATKEAVREHPPVEQPLLKTAKTAPPPIPPVIPRAPAAGQGVTPASAAPERNWSIIEERRQAAQSMASAIAMPPRAVEPEKKDSSFEMRLGTYWLVRIGIVMVLTALVFFGNLAYHNYISKLGPAGKVSLLYLVSGLLLGAGWWWQRKAVKESLKNYAQVLFAGGLAATYFTTYAAHHIKHLLVIPDPALDGVLLLACAGFMVWVADRKKSEALALFAVGLAYYTSIITQVGLFTLYSNLVLTVAAVVFLARNRWAALSFASLIATYAAYGYWRFLHGAEFHWASPDDRLWAGACFLMSYWVVFTAAVFLSKDAKFAGANRASFLTMNNSAFFSLFVLTMWQVESGGFWIFSLSLGAGLLVSAELARRLLPGEPLVKNFYLSQGLLLVTVGFIAKFAGLDLALILAVESVTLLMLGHLRQSVVFRAGACIAGALSVGWGMDGMTQFDARGLWLGMGLGALMLWNALWSHRQTVAPQQRLLRAEPAYFTGLALLIWLVTTWDNTSHEAFPLVLAGEGLVLTMSFYVLCVREISLLGQSYIILAQLAWLANSLESGHNPPWWNPVLLIGIVLFLGHWWQKQAATDGNPRAFLPASSPLAVFWQGLYAIGIVAVLYVWLSARVQAPAWLALTSLLAVGMTAYGVLTRAWWLAIFGQIFLVVSSAQFAWQLAENKPAWALALAPIAALVALSFATVTWFRSKPDPSGRISAPLLQMAMAYRCVALAMSIWWVCAYVPERERIWVLALLGLCLFLLAGWKRSKEALPFSAAFTLAGLALFWLPLLEEPRVYWPDLLAILALLAQRQTARRLPDRYPLEPAVHVAVIVVGGLSLWMFLTRWVLESASGFYLTASWSALALVLFAAGIVLRERVYRWLGLGVLGCALGRVVLFDVWTLEAAYRVLSFLALGIVLLVLGFVYNKYQEKIREWL